MNIRTFTGAERDRRVARAGCCNRCGFQEENLVAWACAVREGVHCEECLANEVADSSEGTRIVYLPEMSVEAFSSYVRVLAWASFAARAELMHGHDFASGALPAAFSHPSSWAAKLRWKTISEGLEDISASTVSRGDLQKVAEASSFLVGRIEHTSRRYPYKSADEAVSALGDESFARSFRVLKQGIPVKRIRSWGAPGSTFFMLANRGAGSRSV